MFRIAAFVALVVCLAASAAQPVRARKAMVVTREAHATDAGVAVLRAGGNAVDAAVAVGFALAVTHPSAGNIGGGGFMLVRLANGRATFLDFRESAPAKATRDMYLAPDGKVTRDSQIGWRAPGVPGTVRGLEMAHRKFGRRKWAEVVEPAVRLARDGFPVSYGLAEGLKSSKALAQFAESRRIFQRDGAPYEAGDTLVQPELAKTLDRIARLGAADFYDGETARRLASEMAAQSGLITFEDLSNYAVVEREPLEGDYRGHHFITAPPPSSGGVCMFQMFGMLRDSGYAAAGAGSASAIHFLTEAMRRSFADRSEHLGDPDHERISVSRLLDGKYIERLRASIDPERATPSESVRPGDLARPESAETTHYSIVDEEGNAVAVTYTLNGGFGSGVTVPGLGFLLNNEMDDFSAKPGEPNLFGLVQGEMNAIKPGKRPLSSMTPTIVLRDGRLLLVLGSPGGPRIISAVTQVALNVVDFNMSLQDAVNWPRVHHQWQPDSLHVEPGVSPDTRALLERRGHRLEPTRTMGEVSAIRVGERWIEGVADPRVDGKAAGY